MPEFYARIHAPADDSSDGYGESLTSGEAAAAKGVLLLDATLTYPSTPPGFSTGATIGGPEPGGDGKFFDDVTAGRQDFMANNGIGPRIVGESIMLTAHPEELPSSLIVKYQAPSALGLIPSAGGATKVLQIGGGYPGSGYLLVTLSTISPNESYQFLEVSALSVWWDGPGGPGGPTPSLGFWTRIIGAEEKIT